MPLTVGPPIAGMLYDQTKSYKLPFILAGIPALVGASIMTLIHRLKDEKIEVRDQEQINVPLAKPAWNEGKNQDSIQHMHRQFIEFRFAIHIFYSQTIHTTSK